MTPEEAQALVDRAATYGDDDVEAILAETVDAGVLAEAVLVLAKLTPVYDYEVQFGQAWSPQGYEYVNLESVENLLKLRTRRNPARIVTRHVTEWEVVE